MMASLYFQSVLSEYNCAQVRQMDLRQMDAHITYVRGVLGDGVAWRICNALTAVEREPTCDGRVQAMEDACTVAGLLAADMTALAQAVGALRWMHLEVGEIIADSRKQQTLRHLKANGMDVAGEAGRTIEQAERLLVELDGVNHDVAPALDMLSMQLPDAIWALMGCAGKVRAGLLDGIGRLVDVVYAWDASNSRARRMHRALCLRAYGHDDPRFDAYIRRANSRARWQSRFLERADEFVHLLASIVLTPMAEKEPLVAARAAREVVLHFADWIEGMGNTRPTSNMSVMVVCDIAAGVLQGALPWFSTRYPQMWFVLEWFERHMSVENTFSE